MRKSKNINGPFSGCGIVGAFAFKLHQKENILNRIDFKRMVNSIHHRGPEAKGIWEKKEDGIQLGHTRLSILDLSERGNQPMTREHLTIVLNGEIYNFKEIRKQLKEDFEFTSGSDTEVVLRAYQKWGVDALYKFNGMFAFAIWDNKKKTLFIARDRIGIKPLYYYKDDKIFLFGSEVQSLMHSRYIPANINWEAVYREILVNSFYQIDLNQTLVKDINSLPHGHFMIVRQNGQAKIENYWDLPETKIKSEESPTELARQLKELLEDSVRLRLVSDVPVAAFLSGGIDSSVINILASRLVRDYKLTAITVSYEGGGKDLFSELDDLDLKYSRIVAETLKDRIHHKIINVKPTEISIESIDGIIDLASFSDDERLLTIFGNYRTVMEQGFKVVLNGQGADEIMGGYIGYNYVIKSIFDIQRPDMDLIKHSFPYMSIPSKNTLSEELLRNVERIYEDLHKYFHHFSGDLLEKTHRYLVNTELQRILKFEDFLSMRSSVECRVPFLDHRIVEWAFRIPFQKQVRAQDRMGKQLMRLAAKDLLPENVINRPKQAFPIADQQRTEKILRKIYQKHRREIIQSEIILRVYKKDFLELKNPQMSSRELWLIITLWRWENKLKEFE